MKKQWILISWLHEKPAELDLHCYLTTNGIKKENYLPVLIRMDMVHHGQGLIRLRIYGTSIFSLHVLAKIFHLFFTRVRLHSALKHLNIAYTMNAVPFSYMNLNMDITFYVSQICLPGA